jgi:hypothetical protein
MTARIFNVLLGVWMLFSVLTFTRNGPQTANVVISGLLCVALALLSIAADPARYMNAALGVWVFLSSFWLQEMHATLWADALAGIAMFTAALLGGSSSDVRRERGEAFGRA